MSNTPDVTSQMPAGGGVSTPASGVYGEDAAEERLMAQLPGEPGADQESGPTPLPPMGGKPPLATAPPSGLPRGIFAPTRQPGVPASTPMAPMGDELDSTPPTEVVRIMQMLAENRTRKVSRTTQRFAQMYLESRGL